MKKHLTPKDKLLLQSLAEHLKSRDVHASITLINSITNPALLPHIVEFTVTNDDHLRMCCEDKVAELVEFIEAKDWLIINWVIRHGMNHYPYEFISPWSQLTPYDVAGLLELSSIPQLLLKFLSSHHSGYVREAAVKLMAKVPEVYFTQVLICANDWVSQVSNRARNILVNSINNMDGEVICENILAHDKLELHGRYDHSDILAECEQKLANPQTLDMLGEMVSKRHFGIARSAFDWLQRLDSRKQLVATIGVKAPDALVRSKALKFAAEHLPDDSLYTVVCLAFGDKTPLIRKRALYIVLERLEPSAFLNKSKAYSHVHSLLFDNSYGLRDTARFYCKKLSIEAGKEDNCIQIYLDKLKLLNPPVSAIIGLSECCDSSYWHYIAPFCSHPLVSIRIAALTAAVRLQVTNADKMLASALVADSVAARNKGVKLQRQFKLLSYEALIGLVNQVDSKGENPKEVSHLYQLIWRADKWRGLALLLDRALLSQPNGQLQQDYNELIEKWQSIYYRPYYFHLPSNEVIAQLNLAITHHEQNHPWLTELSKALS